MQKELSNADDAVGNYNGFQQLFLLMFSYVPSMIMLGFVLDILIPLVKTITVFSSIIFILF